jgi:imidazolonepropionase-like amidohydrolase
MKKNMSIKKNIIKWALGLCLIWQHVHAQNITHVIQNATIHIGDGTIIPNGTIAWELGKIIHVGDKLNATYKNANYIDAKGMHIYPGLICMNTILGLNEIDAVRATRDFQEVGLINPNVRALIAYNTDSKLTPTALFNGIMYIQPTPQGGLISGSSSVVRTKAWNWEDATVRADDGIHIHWPTKILGKNAEKYEQERQKNLMALQQFFEEANVYCNDVKPAETNLRKEAMRQVFAGNKNVYIHVDYASDILDAMQYFRPYRQLRVVWVGMSQAHLVIDELKQYGKPVVLDITHKLPSTNHEDIDMPYKLPYLLINAGIEVALSHSGSWESRNLMFNAGTAAAYGLNPEQALNLITLAPAKILGVADTIGSIAIGKTASFIITTGDVLDMRTNIIHMAFLDGEAIQVKGEQQLLYQKFIKKYGLEVSE